MLIKRLALKKLLSFNDTEVELGQLNVLIGPNAVGKSNLIEVISLLQAAPTNLAAAILRGGGVRQWLWLGDREPSTASIECELTLTRAQDVGPLGYQVEFSDEAGGFVIVGEALSRSTVPIDLEGAPAYFARHYNQAGYGAQAKLARVLDETMKFLPG
jgi:predicted ATPase